MEKKIYLVVYLALILFAGSLLMPALGIAQGTAPVKVNNITVSPSSFRAGNALTITVEVENISRATYGCVGGAYFKVFLDVFKATPPTVSNRLFNTSQTLGAPLSAGEKRTVTFAWTVPNIDTDKFIFSASGPVCAPDEFGQYASRTFMRSCSYVPEPMRLVPRIPLREIILK